MKSIAFSMQKGGTGKTSLAGNVSFLISKDSRILLVDGDPQGSLSSWLLTESPQYELADVLQGRITLQQAIIALEENLFLLPTFGIGGQLKGYSENTLEREPFVFQDLKKEVEKIGIDFIIYDVSPGLGRLERCILLGSDECITPLSPEYFSLDGVQIFTEFLSQIRKGFRKRIKHKKIVLNLVNNRFRRHTIYRDKINNLGYQIFEIGQDAKIPESQMVHKALIDYAPYSRVLPELRRLATAIQEA